MQRIIYIEDDEALAMVTRRALVKRGYEVEHFSELQGVPDSLALFDLALLDLKLEDGISLPFIQRLLEASPSIKIVVLTGYASIATAVQAIKLGATNYLAKPANIDQILQAFEGDGSAEGIDVSAEPDCIVEGENMSLRRLEWEHIQQALVDNNGNISATARQLKMHRRTLQRKLAKKPVSH